MLIRPEHEWRADIEFLEPDAQKLVRRWATNPDRKHLYVYGDRLSGTSYMAEVAVREVLPCLPPTQALIFSGWRYKAVYTTADELVDQARKLWREPDDELNNLRYFHDTFPDSDLVWIDDFHLTLTDYDVFDKDVRPLLERRLKDRLLTVISGSRDPSKFGDLNNFFKQLFLVVPIDQVSATR